MRPDRSARAVRFPRLLAISDRAARDRLRGGLTAPEWAAELHAAGVDGIQIREKHLGDRELERLVREVRARFPGLLLVSGRFDVALAGGADGVHLPADGMPLAPIRRRYGGELIYGCSTHGEEEIVAARAAGADYAVFGPVFATPGKGPPVGLEGLREAATIGLPLLALGGLEAQHLKRVVTVGAAGIAAIRLFHDPAATADAVRFSREQWGRDWITSKR